MEDIKKTETQYNQVIQGCKNIFMKKNKDYGTAWRILRQTSITDQIYIKAKRIKSIEEKGEQKVDEGIESEYQGIINYCVIALILMEHRPAEDAEIAENTLIEMFDTYTNRTKDLMEAKNHDYGEAWRDMRLSTFTDLILQKLLRVKQIENNEGKTIVSEGVAANYMDIVNYSTFALIRMSEEKQISQTGS